MTAITLRPEIYEIIKTVSLEQGIKHHVIKEVQTNRKGEGYLGQIFMVTVSDVKNGKRLDLVIKAAFTEDKPREMAPIDLIFKNEDFFYTTVYPTFRRFEKKRGVLQNTELVPKCLKVSLEDHKEMLVFENLKASGFEVFDKKLSLDDEHVKLVFKTYGRLHAYSFALSDQHPEEYSQLVSGIHNIYRTFTEQPLFAEQVEEVNKLIQSSLIPGEDDEVIQKYEKYKGHNMVNIFREIVTQTFDYSGILHGDCWSNNMMFKYEETGKGRKPIAIRLIDWQLSKVGSPVLDLSYCLYSGVSKSVLDHLDEFLQVYHESFSTVLRQLGSDANRLFPFATLQEHWKKYSRFGMIMGISLLKMKLMDQEEIFDLTDVASEEQLLTLYATTKFDEEEFKNRARGILRHMFEIDAL